MLSAVSYCAQVDDDDNITLIDFPQMVSVAHFNAKELFERDVECIIRCVSCRFKYNLFNKRSWAGLDEGILTHSFCHRFFKKKLVYIPEHDTSLASLRPDFDVSSISLLAGAGPLSLSRGLKFHLAVMISLLTAGNCVRAQRAEGSGC